MFFTSLFHLSHREFSAFHTRSRATIITIGLLFGILLGVTMTLQGLENVVLRHAGEATNGLIYFASDYDGGRRPELVLERIAYYGGEVTVVPSADLQELNFTPQYIAVFRDRAQAYDYYAKDDTSRFNYSANSYRIAELYTRQMPAYAYFRQLNRTLRPLLIILIIAAVFILTFTTAHLIAQSTLNISLYRSLGASRPQIFGIYLAYLFELCFYAAVFAIILALILSGIATACCWSSLQSELIQAYPGTASYPPILLGFNWQCLLIIITIFLSAPLAFLLCIDQFSAKKLASRLKGD